MRRLPFPELSQFQPQRTGDLFHGFDLGISSHPADRVTDMNRGTNTGVEQIGFQENLAVGDRNHIGRNVRGNVAGESR